MNDCARLGWTRRDRRLEPVIFSRRASRSSSLRKGPRSKKGARDTRIGWYCEWAASKQAAHLEARGVRHPIWVGPRFARATCG